MNRVNQVIGETRACFCVGPQNGEPLCPCQMWGLIKRNGRWVRPEQDLGPVSAASAAGIFAPRDPENMDPMGPQNHEVK